ncbi:hypothetical protein D0A37_03565 [Microcoleus vaginatus HSN003]|nr:hypothetical protein D0A37_03565 [Microcoleus vaginatus HSN003]
MNYQTLTDTALQRWLPDSTGIVANKTSVYQPDLYRFRLHRNNKIESTVNTQPFSFLTPSHQPTVNTQHSTVNSQQPTVNSQQ